MTISERSVDEMASDYSSNGHLNGLQKLPNIPVQDVVSGPNESAEHEDREYDVERLKVAARRRALKHIQVKEEDSLSGAFSTWLFEHQIG